MDRRLTTKLVIRRDMVCVTCNKGTLECDCPSALDRIRWLLSAECPLAFTIDYVRQLMRRMLELEGEQELKSIGNDRK
jgi:hypothetical protein